MKKKSHLSRLYKKQTERSIFPCYLNLKKPLIFIGTSMILKFNMIDSFNSKIFICRIFDKTTINFNVPYTQKKCKSAFWVS